MTTEVRSVQLENADAAIVKVPSFIIYVPDIEGIRLPDVSSYKILTHIKRLLI